MSVADLLQFLAGGRKTGTLKFARGSILKKIYLENGRIVGSYSNDPKWFIGQVLLHYGKIDEEELRLGMEVQRESGGRLGVILTEGGFITPDDVLEVLKTRTLEIIYDLFIWEEADFEFFDHEALPEDLIRIEVDATSVIMDGIYRIDEWNRYRQVIPSERTFFELNPGWTQKTKGSNKETRELLYHIEKHMTAAEICYNMHTSLFHASALLFDLIDKGVIKVAGEAAISEAPSDLSALKLPQTVPELTKLAQVELKEGNIENALAIIHSALEQEPQNVEVDRLRQQAEQKFIDHVYKNGLSPHAVPELRASFEQLEQERFGPEEGFVISRVNGESDIASILSVCPFREADVLRMLKKMVDSGIVGIK